MASEVAACEESRLPFAKDQLSAHLKGKALADEAAAAAVNDASRTCIIKPSFI